MQPNSIMPRTSASHHATPPTVKQAPNAGADVDVLTTPTKKKCSPSLDAFVRTQRDLQAFASDVALEWALPHRRYIAWPHRCKHIARRILQAGSGAGISSFPAQFQRTLDVPMVDSSPRGKRYASALSMWHRGLLAIADSPSGCCPADIGVVLSAVADNTARALEMHGSKLASADVLALKASNAKLRASARGWDLLDAALGR